jgi:hypothetical protein
MARNIRRRNRPTQSQPGLLDYIGEGWDAVRDSGSPWFSPNHPATIASRNIDWENPGDINDPDKREQLSIIGDSIGGGSNSPGALFGGGLLGGMVKRVPIKSGAKMKTIKEGESIIAKTESGFGGDYILTRNPSKGQNWLEGAPTSDWKSMGVDMSKASKKVAKPEGDWRISQMENMDPLASDSWKFTTRQPVPWGHHAYSSFEDAWEHLQKVGKDFQHLSLDNPPIGAPAYLQGSRKLEDVTGLFDLNKGGYPNVPQVRGDLFRPLKPHKEAADIVKVLKSSKQQKHLEEWFEEGAKQGGMEWYNTNHLKKFATEQFGDDMGIQLYERFLRYNAALSPNTAVIPNIRQASYWNTLDELNVPFAEQIATRTLAPIPPTYGRMGLQSVKGLLASAKEGTKGPILLGGKNIKTAGVPKYAHDLQTTFPIGASKVNSFWENLRGNLSSATLDAGAMRAIAGKVGGAGKKATELRTSASKEIYGAVEDEFAKFAQKMGVAPAQAQASIWGGASKYTGVGKAPVGLPEGATWMEMLMSRVNKTALETGKPPKQVLTELLSGNQVLRSMVAPLLTTGAVGGLLGKEEGL